MREVECKEFIAVFNLPQFLVRVYVLYVSLIDVYHEHVRLQFILECPTK